MKLQTGMRVLVPWKGDECVGTIEEITLFIRPPGRPAREAVCVLLDELVMDGERAVLRVTCDSHEVAALLS